MDTETLKRRGFYYEFEFITSRSGGKGGQNVNKVSTKVELRFSVFNSNVLTDAEKETVRQKLAAKISNEGILQVVCQTERSQLQNKEIAIEKFYSLMATALTPRKRRKPTKLPRGVKRKRSENKRIVSKKKDLRKRVIDSE